MNNRNKILAGLLVVQVILVGVMFWRTEADSPIATALLKGLAAERVNGLQITDEEGRKLVLRREAEGWQVELEKDVWYPADQDKVGAMLTKLVSLSASRLVTRTRVSHGRLKVAGQKFSRRLELAGDERDPVVLYLGTAPDHKSIHARAAADDHVYLVKDLSAWEVQVDTGAWWRTSYLELDPGSLIEVRLRNDKGELVLERSDPKGAWSLRGSELKLDQEKVAGFLDDASQLSVTDITLPSAPKPEGEPLAVLNLTSAGRQTELLIWDRKDENGDHPVKSSADSFYAMVGRYAVDDLLNIDGIALVDPELHRRAGQEKNGAEN